MKKGDKVELKMLKKLCAGETRDDQTYFCEVLKYDENKEDIYLVLKNTELTKISLDVIYDCKIVAEKETINCTGRIMERYGADAGKILKLQVENGFYKINLKCVDKQMA